MLGWSQCGSVATEQWGCVCYCHQDKCHGQVPCLKALPKALMYLNNPGMITVTFDNELQHLVLWMHSSSCPRVLSNRRLHAGPGAWSESEKKRERESSPEETEVSNAFAIAGSLAHDLVPDSADQVASYLIVSLAVKTLNP